MLDFTIPLGNLSPKSTCKDICSQVDHVLEIDEVEKDENCVEVINNIQKLVNSSLDTSRDNSTQVTSGELIIPFISLIDSLRTLTTMTGIPPFELFDKIVELVLKTKQSSVSGQAFS